MEVFTVEFKDIKGRLDPLYYSSVFTTYKEYLQRCKYDLVKLDELLEELYRYPTFYGITYKKSGVPVAKISNIDDSGFLEPLDSGNYDFIDKEISDKFPRTILKEGDLVMAVRGATIGKMAFVSKEFKNANINANLIKLSLNIRRIIPFYFWVFFRSEVGQNLFLQNVANTAKQTITVPQIRNLKVPLPPLPVQERIIRLVDEAYSKQRQNEEEAERLLGLSDEVVSNNLGVNIIDHKKTKVAIISSIDIQGRLDPLFYISGKLDFVVGEVNLIKLEDVCIYFKSGFAAGKQSQAEETTEVIQLRPTNIDKFGRLYFDKNVYIDSGECEKRKDDLLQQGEVLFNNTNSQELVGKTTFFDLEKSFFCSNHITRIGTNPSRLLPEYLWVILNLYRRQCYFFNICTNWNNQSGVNINLLKSIQIPLPDLEIQKRIVKEIKENISQSEELITESNTIIENTQKEVEQILFEQL